MSLEQTLERIASALEAQNKLTETLIADITPVQEEELTPVPEKALTPGTSQTVGEQLQGAEVKPTPEPEKKDFVWNPQVEPIQGSYRTQDKKDAINSTLAMLNISVKKSWNYVKRHQLILDYVEGLKGSGEEMMNDAAEAEMSLDEFVTKLKANMAVIGKDAVVAEVEKITGQPVVSEDNCKGHFAQILAATEPQPEEEVKKEDTADDLLSDTPKEKSTYTMDDLTFLARGLVGGGVKPEQIQAAIQHIAPGVTQVPTEKIDEAMSALEKLGE